MQTVMDKLKNDLGMKQIRESLTFASLKKIKTTQYNLQLWSPATIKKRGETEKPNE